MSDTPEPGSFVRLTSEAFDPEQESIRASAQAAWDAGAAAATLTEAQQQAAVEASGIRDELVENALRGVSLEPLEGDLLMPGEAVHLVGSPDEPVPTKESVVFTTHYTGRQFGKRQQAAVINDLADQLLNPDRRRHEAVKRLIAMMALAMGYQAEHGDQVDVDKVVTSTRDALLTLGVTTDQFKAASEALRRETGYQSKEGQ